MASRGGGALTHGETAGDEQIKAVFLLFWAPIPWVRLSTVTVSVTGGGVVWRGNGTQQPGSNPEAPPPPPPQTRGQAPRGLCTLPVQGASPPVGENSSFHSIIAQFGMARTRRRNAATLHIWTDEATRARRQYKTCIEQCAPAEAGVATAWK